MIKPNPNRNEIIYSLWEQGYTVDQIALRAGIPRSTVGYYVRKFNRYAKDGRITVIPQENRKDTSGTLASVIFKCVGLSNLLDMLKSGKVEEAYYLLSICKLLKEIERDLLPTSEEVKSIERALGINKEM